MPTLYQVVVQKESGNNSHAAEIAALQAELRRVLTDRVAAEKAATETMRVVQSAAAELQAAAREQREASEAQSQNLSMLGAIVERQSEIIDQLTSALEKKTSATADS